MCPARRLIFDAFCNKILDSFTVEKIIETDYRSIFSLIAISSNYLAFSGLERFDSELRNSEKNCKIVVWKIDEKKCVCTLTDHKAPVHTLAFFKDKNWLISGSEDKTIKIWDIEKEKCLYTLKGHKAIVRTLAFFKDKNWSKNYFYII